MTKRFSKKVLDSEDGKGCSYPPSFRGRAINRWWRYAQNGPKPPAKPTRETK